MEKYEVGDSVEVSIDGKWFPAIVKVVRPYGNLGQVGYTLEADLTVDPLMIRGPFTAVGQNRVRSRQVPVTEPVSTPPEEDVHELEVTTDTPTSTQESEAKPSKSAKEQDTKLDIDKDQRVS